MRSAPPPRLSVVLALPDGVGAPAPLLAALASTLGDQPAIELLVVTSGEEGLPTANPGWRVRRCRADRGLLVPERWGVGLRAAEGELVAFLTPDVVPLPGWWPELEGLISGDGVVGVAGGIELARDPAAAAGAYLARYSAFLPSPGAAPATRADLPGEVTIYRRGPLLEQADLVRDGFWEVSFHRRLRADGWRLLFVAEPLARYTGRPGIVAMLQQRWQHATLFGFERVAQRRTSRLALLLRAPAVPLILLGRLLRRAIGSPSGRQALIRGLLPLAAYSVAWAAGEAFGGWRAGRAGAVSRGGG